MTRGRIAVLAVAIAVTLTALAVVTAAGGGDDGDKATKPDSSVEAPRDDGPREPEPPPPGLEGLPPGFVECMAAQGFDVRSQADIHAAPPQVLQLCFSH